NNLQAVALSDVAVRLTWDQVTGADSYEVQRDTGGSVTTFNPPQPQSAGSVVFDDTSALTPNTAYNYSVKAVNGSPAQKGAAAAAASTTTSMTAPTASVFSRNDAQVVLHWNVIPGIAGYRVFRSTDGSLGTRLGPDPTVGAGVSGYTDLAVAPGTNYFYSVQVVGTAANAGNPTVGPLATNTTMRDVANFRVTATTSTQVSLAWNASTESTLIGYVITRTGG